MKGLAFYLALRLGVGAVGLVPGPLVRRLGQIGGVAWWAVAPGRRRMARRHMRRVLGEGGRVGGAARAVFASYGRYWAESFWARPHRLVEMRRGLSLEGDEHLRTAHEQGKGVILAVPHVGNWEVAAPIAQGVGIPLVAVAERLANERVNRWLTGLRRLFGIEVVLTGGDVIRRLEAALAARKAVALLADRDLSGRGITVRFFGEETTLPAGPAVLSLRSGAPILPAAAYFLPGGGHHVVVGAPLTDSELNHRRDRTVALTQALAERLEELIRAHPTQWHLIQPNWPSDRR